MEMERIVDISCSWWKNARRILEICSGTPGELSRKYRAYVKGKKKSGKSQIKSPSEVFDRDWSKIQVQSRLPPPWRPGLSAAVAVAIVSRRGGWQEHALLRGWVSFVATSTSTICIVASEWEQVQRVLELFFKVVLSAPHHFGRVSHGTRAAFVANTRSPRLFSLLFTFSFLPEKFFEFIE